MPKADTTPRPIRVLDVITTPQGAKRLLAHRVSSINRDESFENYLASPAEAQFTGDFESKGIRFIPFPMSRGLSPVATLREIRSFYRLLKELRPDVVHAHTSKAGAVSRIACLRYNGAKRRQNRILVLYQVHSFYFNALSGFKRFLYLSFETILARMSHALLFQNAEELAQARGAHMLSEKRLYNIGNGVNLKEFTLPKAPLSAGVRPFPILCVARVEEKKNHRMLIEVADVLKKRIGPKAFHIRCVGEIGMDEIPALVTERGLSDVIDFAGLMGRDALSRELERARLSVLTSSAEGKPRALMESMAFGLPCVATDVCGTRDVVVQGENGELVPYDDVEGFATAIEKLMEDKALYERYSIAAQKKAFAEFDEDAVIERLKALYRRLLENLRV